MVCQRCHGLLVWDTFDDLNIGTGALYAATRCINCGYIEDAVVRANRFRRSAKRRVTSRGRGRTSNVERIKIHVDAYASIR
jgi:lysozyme family protein